ncbi:2TM domain-containing protein [Olleya aquimaris]|uniref:2TM domain-containing protein n=1 Tax=Olleya aquimaris TaxID=639310 RepID=A0A327RL06_9FLAO|nr:2TM domain-containing protein [Olleya aquimaris]RAJ16845.1 2TM domain-containing protein [Olleya aquimaris]
MREDIQPYLEDDMQVKYEKEEAYLRAKKKVEKIVGFYWHLAFYVVINLVLVLFIYSKSGQPFWSFAVWSTPLFWGIGIGFHFLGVFGTDFLFGKDWEARKIEKYMNEERKNKRWE